jgi:hypothetical protein
LEAEAVLGVLQMLSDQYLHAAKIPSPKTHSSSGAAMNG